MCKSSYVGQLSMYYYTSGNRYGITLSGRNFVVKGCSFIEMLSFSIDNKNDNTSMIIPKHSSSILKQATGLDA